MKRVLCKCVMSLCDSISDSSLCIDRLVSFSVIADMWTGTVLKFLSSSHVLFFRVGCLDSVARPE